MAPKFNPYVKAPKTIDRKTGEEFNPVAAGKVGGQRKLSAGKMFNDKGEINGNSKKEVVEKIAALLDGLNDGTYEVSREASYGESMGVGESENILREAFADPTSEGFRQVGQALLNPIKEVIDYEGLSRKIWALRTVKSGEVIRYDRDVYVTGWVIAEDGQTPESVVEGKYIYPPEFEVTANPSIELKDKFRAQFDILARAQDKARQAIEYREDLATVNVLTAGGNQANVTSFFPTLNLAALEAMRYQIERHRLVCDKYLINRQEASDLVTVLSGAVDPVTQRELIMAGYLGTILNASLITTAGTDVGYEILPAGRAMAVAAPEHLGGMPIRVELFSEPYNQFVLGLPRQGWYWYELLSMTLINAKGVALGQRL